MAAAFPLPSATNVGRVPPTARSEGLAWQTSGSASPTSTGGRPQRTGVADDRESGVTSGVSQTQSEAAVMEQTAAKFNQVNEQLQQMLSSLMSQLEVLESAWRGQGGTKFTEVKTQYAADQKAIGQALAETASAIRTAGQQYTASDTEAAGRLNTTSSLSLPL